MDATKFILEKRQELVDYSNNYTTYARKLTTRLRSTKKRLSVPDKTPTKSSSHGISATQLAQNHEFINIPLLKAERCWAKSMAWQSRDIMTSDTRSNIISKLAKAVNIVQSLVATLSDSASNATTSDILSAKAYAAVLKGDIAFRSRKWEESLNNYSVAKIIYSSLPSSNFEGSSVKDFVSDSVDTPLRFAQRQQNIPMTLSIIALSKRHFPRSDESLVSGVEEVSPGFLNQDDETNSAQGGAIRTVIWRNREVPVEDAEISLKLDAFEAAISDLSQELCFSDSRPNTKAEAYDSVLEISNDAVDTTQRAIDELKGQGVPQGDPRMQNLATLRTKLSYDLLSCQIGRNRVLMGIKDGAVQGDGPSMKKFKGASDLGEAVIKDIQQFKQLEEKVNLYDKTLQSLDVAKELQGVAADGHLAAEIDAVFRYFTALKSLAIARSHTLIGNPANALALIQYALGQCEAAVPILYKHGKSKDAGLKTIEVHRKDAEGLLILLKGELQRCRALVEIAKLRRQASKGDSEAAPRPLIDRLGRYPAEGVDLSNIVTYPPNMEPIPVKPLFLDVAWNYVKYPQKEEAHTSGLAGKATSNEEAEKQTAKKGWFGFGRG